MNIDQLFKALPRDLQWDILSEYVGTHSVRKGKLMTKMVFDDRDKIVKAIPRIFKCGIWLYKTNYNTITDVQMWDGSQLMFCQNPVSGEMGYTFRKRVTRTHSSMPKCWRTEYVPMNDSVILPPFEKHSYPSYEDTKKKKEARYPGALKRACPERPRSSSPIGPPPR